MFLFDLLCAIPNTLGNVQRLVKSVGAGFAGHNPRLPVCRTQRSQSTRNRVAYLFFQTFESAGWLKLPLAWTNGGTCCQGHHFGGTAGPLNRFHLFYGLSHMVSSKRQGFVPSTVCTVHPWSRRLYPVVPVNDSKKMPTTGCLR